MSHEVVGQSVGVISEKQLYPAETVQIMKRVALIVVFFVFLMFVASQKGKILHVVDHPVSQVNVTGKFDHVTASRIQGVLHDVVGMGFLTADLSMIKAKVEQLPWVDSAMVTRVWPGEIQLEIKEQIAVSYWNGVSFLNSKGEVFTPRNISHGMALPVLQGVGDTNPEQRVKMLDTFSYLQSRLQPYGLVIKRLELKPRGVWEMSFKNGVSVALGEIKNLHADKENLLNEKLERVGKVFTSSGKINIDEIKRIDARYPNGVAIKWKESTLLAGAIGAR